MGHPRYLFAYFCLFYKQTVQFLQQINVMNVLSVQGTGIQTRDLITSLLP